MSLPPGNIRRGDRRTSGPLDFNSLAISISIQCNDDLHRRRSWGWCSCPPILGTFSFSIPNSFLAFYSSFSAQCLDLTDTVPPTSNRRGRRPGLFFVADQASSLDVPDYNTFIGEPELTSKETAVSSDLDHAVMKGRYLCKDPVLSTIAYRNRVNDQQIR